ncbi:MAG: hypothetical protein LUF83_10185, partial [Alistipes sp.]|nr:hypothetical protein [Alistipes sp.]
SGCGSRAADSDQQAVNRSRIGNFFIIRSFCLFSFRDVPDKSTKNVHVLPISLQSWGANLK